MTEPRPRASRPQTIPKGYGIPAGRKGMLAWARVRALFGTAPRYWIATTNRDGSPHVVQQWGAWADGALFFEGSPETLWARNLVRNPSVVVSAEWEDHAVILHGRGEPIVPNPALAAEVVDGYAAKYLASDGYRPTPEGWARGGLFVVRPSHVLAWDRREFPRTATRFDFGARSGAC